MTNDDSGPQPHSRPGEMPKYVAVRQHLEDQLRAGAFESGRRLPSSRHLASALGVSRNTVTLAYQELAATGLIVSVPRSGMYPAPRRSARRGGGRLVAATDRESGRSEGTSAPDWARHLGDVPATQAGGAVLEPEYLDFDYPFLPGQIELRQFPARSWISALHRALEGPHLRYSLRDSADLDDPLLVEEICTSVLRAKKIHAEPENILVTAGAQQALSLLAEALSAPGRRIAVEDPGYIDGVRAFEASGAEVVRWPVEPDGVMVPDRLDVDAVYITPSHQHPTNVTLSSAKRGRLLAAARAEDVVIIEDDFDSEIRYRGAPTWPIKAGDPEGRVIYLGTFSKFLAPGLRLGFICASPEVIARLRRLRYVSTKHPSGLLQRGLGLFIRSGDYHRTLRRHRSHLRTKWELLGTALHEHLDWDLPPAPTGGLSYWITGPTGTDGEQIAAEARIRSLLVSPGRRYYSGVDRPTESLRIGFAAIAPERIDPGVRVLADVIREVENRRQDGNVSG